MTENDRIIYISPALADRFGLSPRNESDAPLETDDDAEFPPEDYAGALAAADYIEPEYFSEPFDTDA